MTELSKRKLPEGEQSKEDEDGPLSSSEGEADEEQAKDDNAETDDEKMSSGESEGCAKADVSAFADELYAGYFEKQREAKCAIHALNNAVGRPFCSDEDMEAAAEECLASFRREGVREDCVGSSKLVLNTFF